MRKLFILIGVFLSIFISSISHSSTFTTTQLTNNSYDDKSPAINANGSVVWYGDDGSDYEIYLAVSNDSTSTLIAIPTMNEWEVFVFIVLAGFGSFYYLKKL